jgi:uncharacterized protein (TIGR02186 family)
VIRCLAALCVFAAAACAAGGALAERLTIALSTTDVHIDSSFTGTNIAIFGAIERDAGTISRVGAYEVATLVLGPPQTVVARRKDRLLGIWANAGAETFIAIPSFYAVNTSHDVAQLASKALAEKLQVGFDNVAFDAVGGGEGASEFRDAFLRLKREAGLYSEMPNGVEFIGDSIFRTNVWIPANVPVGDYRVAVFLFAGDALLAQATSAISVTKTGVERFMFNLAHREALVYGLACVVLAVFSGWLAGVIFRRD